LMDQELQKLRTAAIPIGFLEGGQQLLFLSRNASEEFSRLKRLWWLLLGGRAKGRGLSAHRRTGRLGQIQQRPLSRWIHFACETEKQHKARRVQLEVLIVLTGCWQGNACLGKGTQPQKLDESNIQPPEHGSLLFENRRGGTWGDALCKANPRSCRVARLRPEALNRQPFDGTAGAP